MGLYHLPACEDMCPVNIQHLDFILEARKHQVLLEESLGPHINVERAREIIATHADYVAVACPYCTTMLEDGLKECDSGIKVLDIAELLAQQV